MLAKLSKKSLALSNGLQSLVSSQHATYAHSSSCTCAFSHFGEGPTSPSALTSAMWTGSLTGMLSLMSIARLFGLASQGKATTFVGAVMWWTRWIGRRRKSRDTMSGRFVLLASSVSNRMRCSCCSQVCSSSHPTPRSLICLQCYFRSWIERQDETAFFPGLCGIIW